MSTNLFIPDPETNDFVFDGHAGASPSGAERWMTCTASLAETRAFLETLSPRQMAALAQGSSAARQGTTAHSAAEIELGVMLGTMDEDEARLSRLELSVMPVSEDEALDSEMADYITEYVDLVKQYHDAGREVLIEQRLSAAVPLTGNRTGDVHEIHGSGDVVVLPSGAEPELVVGDLKYGKGVDVSAEANPQARIYALGALARLVDGDGALTVPVEKVTYYIVQPRSGGIKEWSESLDDLLAWRDAELAPALTAALYGPAEGAKHAPSESACQWCPARGSCTALAEQRIAAAADLFDAVVEAEFDNGPGSFPETAAMGDDRLGQLLEQVNGLVDLQSDLKAEAERRLLRGQEVPGFKLIGYQPNRRWSEDAADALAEDERFWDRKIVSPATAEKILKIDAEDTEAYKRVMGLVEKPDRIPKIAPEGDRRKDWGGPAPDAMFADENKKEQA